MRCGRLWIRASGAEAWLLGAAGALAALAGPCASAAQTSPTGVKIVAVDDDCFTLERLQKEVDKRLDGAPVLVPLRFDWVLRDGGDGEPVLRVSESGKDWHLVPTENIPVECRDRLRFAAAKIEYAVRAYRQPSAPPEDRGADAGTPAVEGSSSSPPSVTAMPTIAPPKTSSPPLRPVPPASHEVGPQISTSLEFAFVAGLTSKFAPGSEVDLEATLGKVRDRVLVDLRAGAFFVGRESISAPPAQANVMLAAGRADGCAGGDVGQLRLRGCLGLLAGALIFQASGLSPSHSPTVPWLAVPLRLDATWRVNRLLGLRLGIDGIVSLGHTALVLQQDTTRTNVGAVPRGGVVGGLGPVIFFR